MASISHALCKSAKAANALKGFSEYPLGMSFRSDLPYHLDNSEKLTKNGVLGGHDVNMFMKFAEENDVLKTPVQEGTHYIEYRAPMRDRTVSFTGDKL